MRPTWCCIEICLRHLLDRLRGVLGASCLPVQKAARSSDVWRLEICQRRNVAMAPGPTPQRQFEAWGQAIYQVKATSKTSQGPSTGLIVLFAISDINREWLGWYSFNTDSTPDIILLGSTHDVLGEGSARSSHFKRQEPVQVDELCGPSMVSRGGSSGAILRRAVISPGHHQPDSDTIDLNISIHASPGLTKQIHAAHPIRLHIKRKQTGAPDDKIRFGWVTFVMAELFKYPIPHLNVKKRLRVFEHNLTS
jgi:hypothetical protein